MADGDGTNLIMQTLLQIQKDIGENTAVCASIRNDIAEHIRKDEIVHVEMFSRVRSIETSHARQRGAVKVLAVLWSALVAVAGAVGGYLWHK
jgi:anthranilate/para-aminobenzoate synthase component I